MKRRIYHLILLTILLVLVSCGLSGRQVVNNIINKEINVGEITIEDLQTMVQTTIEKVETSVVGINYTYRKGLVTTTSIGSGVIISREAVLKNPSQPEIDNNIATYRYLAVTNRHVISHDSEIASNIKIYLGNIDEETPASIVTYDNQVDLALLSFEYPAKYIPIKLADSTTIKKGSFVIAIGNPSSFDYYGSATFGIVSHPLRYLEDTAFNNKNIKKFNKYIQHDAAINAGNSGGGLFDIFGELLGINTLKIIGEENDIDNMGFSIPSEEIKAIFKDYLP